MLGSKNVTRPPKHVRPKISAGVNEGLSGGSSGHRPGSGASGNFRFQCKIIPGLHLQNRFSQFMYKIVPKTPLAYNYHLHSNPSKEEYGEPCLCSACGEIKYFQYNWR